MATSPNYGWLEPDNTDLVKNGALAIRTLGNAIDSTMATMVPKSIVDAKGDLIAGTAADTPARLAVGNNGETLVADSSTSTGLRYTAGNVNQNPVLNSAFQVWQRGTSIANSGTAYGPDRWSAYRTAGNSTTSRQATGDTTNLPFIQYCARVQRTSGDTGTQGIYLYQSMETINSIPYVGKIVTLSFYARKGANYSQASSAVAVRLNTGTGTDQNWAAYTGGSVAIDTNAILTTTWQRFTYTSSAAIATTVNELAISFGFDPTGTAGAADYFEVTGVQLDVGSVALPFRTYAGTIQGELQACQRYFYSFGANAPIFQDLADGNYYDQTAFARATIQFKTTMRVNNPTLTVSSTASDYGVLLNTGYLALTAVPYLTNSTPNLANVALTRTGVTGQAASFRAGTSNPIIYFNAEL